MKNELLLHKNDMVVFDGDSLTNRRVPPALDTWPYLRLMHWERTYADDVAEFLFCNLPELGLRFHNVGVGGQSSRNLLERLETQVIAHRPAWVIMTIGSNDVVQKIPLKEFECSIEKYLRQIRETCGGRVMILGGFRAGPHLSDVASMGPGRVPYDRILRKLGRRHHGIWVDAGRALYRKAMALTKTYPGHTVYSDGTHLNAVGNLILATEAIRALGYRW